MSSLLPNWLKQYQLFFFDFDGLLVNTEEVHFMAYRHMCAARGVHLDWDFPEYCRSAHYEATALRDRFYKDFPTLFKNGETWDELYQEKKQALMQLVKSGAVQLMPGVESFLKILAEHHLACCVVTHSPQDFVAILRNQHPILNSIPHWVTRENYQKPKPDPDCYFTAMRLYGKAGERSIGFEDTPRGLTALLKTDAQSVLVSRIQYPEIPAFIREGVIHYPSFIELLEEKRTVHP